MTCRKCKAELPIGAKFCPACGAKQDITRKPKSRGNGTGTVYQLPNKTWIALRVVATVPTDDGKVRRITRSKSGFKTKKEALAALYTLQNEPATKAEKKLVYTMQQVYDAWEPTHKKGKSTINGYRAAMKHFASLHNTPFSTIDIDDLQEALDECPAGKRTRENMKALAGLLYKYAIPRHMATINLGQYLVINADGTSERHALPLDAVEKLAAAGESVPCSSYIVAQCYLGFRPSELLALDVEDYDREKKLFVGGAKTEAGRDRTVTISPKIQPIIDALTRDKIKGPVFCREDGRALSLGDYRKAFYAALEAIGVDNPVEVINGVPRHFYTPHSCRHTFATLLKNVAAPDADKLRLIGHTSTEMLRHYQEVDVESLRKITDAL